MGRRTQSTSYVTPIKSDGTVETMDATELGRGAFTLASGTTYYFPIACGDARNVSVHLQCDAAIILTSATIEDCNFPEVDVTNYSSTAGHWIDEDPSTAFVGLVGTGYTHSSGVVAVAGGAAGGAMWHVADVGARRMRLKVVVGGTGGEVRVATWAKE